MSELANILCENKPTLCTDSAANVTRISSGLVNGVGHTSAVLACCQISLLCYFSAAVDRGGCVDSGSTGFDIVSF